MVRRCDRIWRDFFEVKLENVHFSYGGVLSTYTNATIVVWDVTRKVIAYALEVHIALY